MRRSSQPVVSINGKLFGQGVVPDADVLRQEMEKYFNARNNTEA
jgi:hypothetical protein